MCLEKQTGNFWKLIGSGEGGEEKEDEEEEEEEEEEQGFVLERTAGIIAESTYHAFQRRIIPLRV